MNYFNTDGFLSGELYLFKIRLMKEYEKYFTLAIKINQMIMNNISSIKFSVTQKDAIIGSLFCKCITSFQTVIMLSSYGLPNEAEVVLRSLLEATSILILCCNDEKYYEEYLKSHSYQRYYTLRKIKKNLNHPNLSKDEYNRIDSLIKTFYKSDEIESADKNYKEYKKYKLLPSELAKKAGMEYNYYTVYAYLSMTAHNQPKTLEHYIHGDNNTIQFDITPHIDEGTLTFLIVSSCELMMKIFEKIHEYQKLEIPEEFIVYRSQVELLIPKD